MKHLKIALLIGITSSVLVTSAIANTVDNQNPFTVRVEGGLTGYGGAVIYNVNPYVGLVLGYNGGQVNWRDNIKINGFKYDIDMNNNVPYLNAMIRPWGTSESPWISGLYTAVGLGYIGDTYDIERHFAPGEKIHNHLKSYKVGNNGVTVKGQLEYENTIAPYVGIGLAPKFNSNWSFFTEIGVYYAGDLDVKITHVNEKALNPYLDDASKEIKYQLDDQKLLRWNPVAKIGVTYSF